LIAGGRTGDAVGALGMGHNTKKYSGGQNGGGRPSRRASVGINTTAFSFSFLCA
jgi:hypothetical protein